MLTPMNGCCKYGHSWYNVQYCLWYGEYVIQLYTWYIGHWWQQKIHTKKSALEIDLMICQIGPQQVWCNTAGYLFPPANSRYRPEIEIPTEHRFSNSIPRILIRNHKCRTSVSFGLYGLIGRWVHNRQQAITGSGNGLAPDRRQAITWTNDTGH